MEDRVGCGSCGIQSIFAVAPVNRQVLDTWTEGDRLLDQPAVPPTLHPSDSQPLNVLAQTFAQTSRDGYAEGKSNLVLDSIEVARTRPKHEVGRSMQGARGEGDRLEGLATRSRQRRNVGCNDVEHLRQSEDSLGGG